jgi:hypothetical protein
VLSGLKQFQQLVKILMFPRPKPKGNSFTALVINSPPQPDLTLLIMIKTPHSVRFYANPDVFMGFGTAFVRLFYHFLFF